MYVVLPMHREPTDAELHLLIAAGDERALELWQDRTGQDVLRMVANAGLSSADAEDIWNEAFFAVWNRVQHGEPLEPPGPITVNVGSHGWSLWQ